MSTVSKLGSVSEAAGKGVNEKGKGVREANTSNINLIVCWKIGL